MPIAKNGYDFTLDSSVVTPDGQTWTGVGTFYHNQVPIKRVTVEVDRIVPPADSGGTLSFGNTSVTKDGTHAQLQGFVSDNGLQVVQVVLDVIADNRAGLFELDPQANILPQTPPRYSWYLASITTEDL